MVNINRIGLLLFHSSIVILFVCCKSKSKTTIVENIANSKERFIVTPDSIVEPYKSISIFMKQLRKDAINEKNVYILSKLDTLCNHRDGDVGDYYINDLIDIFEQIPTFRNNLIKFKYNCTLEMIANYYIEKVQYNEISKSQLMNEIQSIMQLSKNDSIILKKFISSKISPKLK